MNRNNSIDTERKIRAVQISISIINELQDRGQAGVTELASELGHSKSTVYSHLRTLEGGRLVVRDGETFRLSLRLLKMATDVRSHLGNFDVIRSEVNKIANETGEIAQFGIEEHGMVSYLHKKAGDQAVETASSVGTQQPMYSTALGKTILAYLPEGRTEEIIQDTDFRSVTEHTISSSENLRDQLNDIRDRGYGIDDEENIEGLRCVAAPVKDDETVFGAISISGPSSRFNLQYIHDDLSEEVQRAANVIELNTRFA